MPDGPLTQAINCPFAKNVFGLRMLSIRAVRMATDASDEVLFAHSPLPRQFMPRLWKGRKSVRAVKRARMSISCEGC